MQQTIEFDEAIEMQETIRAARESGGDERGQSRRGK
jgi:hypothetical protein